MITPIWVIVSFSFPNESTPTNLALNFVVMRVEWAKADARVSRWVEEKSLVMEEMRRTPLYLDWKARWWEELSHPWTKDMFDVSRPNSRVDFNLFHAGLTAYAEKQADVQRALASKFTTKWIVVLGRHELTLAAEWPTRT
jgi:hypothetical protein